MDKLMHAEVGFVKFEAALFNSGQIQQVVHEVIQQTNLYVDVCN